MLTKEQIEEMKRIWSAINDMDTLCDMADKYLQAQEQEPVLWAVHGAKNVQTDFSFYPTKIYTYPLFTDPVPPKSPEPIGWIQSNHLDHIKHLKEGAFMCRIAGYKIQSDFKPIYADPLPKMQSNDDDFKRSEAERIGEFRSNCSTQSSDHPTQQEDQREQQSNTYCPHGVPHRYPCEECDKQFSDHPICAEEQKLLDEYAACFSEPTDAEKLANDLSNRLCSLGKDRYLLVSQDEAEKCIAALRKKERT